MENKPEPASHEREVCGIKILKPSHPELRQLKKAHNPSAQGYKLWNSTWLLLDFLEGQDLAPGTRVLDAGCGWGLAGICCARHYQARVTAVDIDPEVFPFLRLHAQANEVEIHTLAAGFDAIPASMLRQQDLLIGADICFRDSMVEPLYRLVERALQAGVQRIALSDPGRRAFEKLGAWCAQNLGAVVHDWQAQEPLIAWSGAGLQIRGRLLLIGSTDSATGTAVVRDLTDPSR